VSPAPLRAHGIALLTVVIWSLTFVQTKVLLLYLSPVEILIDRFSLAWALFWVLMPRRRATTIRDEGYFALLGATGIFGYYILENMALKYTTAVHVGLIVTTAPIFTALILMVSRAFDRRYVLGMVGGFLLVAAGFTLDRVAGVSHFGIDDDERTRQQQRCLRRAAEGDPPGINRSDREGIVTMWRVVPARIFGVATLCHFLPIL